MADKTPEHVAYTITSGFYPELAASLKYKRAAKGKGQVGQKYIRKRGFTDTSVVRAETRGMTDLEKAAAVGGASAGSLEGKSLYGEATYTDKTTGAVRSYYKFRGGGEMYKLYGDLVWYMAGTRPSDERALFTDYITDVWGNKNPRFNKIYSRMEPLLAAEAIRLAEEMFDIALEEVEIELQACDGTQAAEESGYKEGDFEYMSHAEAIRRYPHLAGQLKPTSELTRANSMDMVKIRGSGKDAVIEFVQDVTEMDVLSKGQHGVTRVPDELKDAIKSAKQEGGSLSKIKEALINMYQNAIRSDYNPLIREMKQVAGIGGKSGKGKVGNKKWDDVLKGINEKVGKKPTDKVATQTIGKALGQNTWRVGYHEQHLKSAKQTSIEYVAHIMGSMNEAMQDGFKQSHRVYDFDDGSGQSVYATVPMEVDQETWFFKPEVVKGTEVFSGYSATIGQELAAGVTMADNGLTHSKSQKQAYAMAKATGMTTSATGVGLATANMGSMKGARPTTLVTIPANDKLEEMLIKELEGNLPDLSGRLGDKGSKLKNRTYGLGKRRRDMKIEQDKGRAMFWALPYVGVLQSEYIQK